MSWSYDPRYEMGAVASRCPRGMRVQSLRFDKHHWSAEEARRWAAAHGYPTGIDTKPTWNYYAIRIEDPKHFTDPWAWGKPWLPGLFPVYGCPKSRYPKAAVRPHKARYRVRPAGVSVRKKRAVAGIGSVSSSWRAKLNPRRFPGMSTKMAALVDWFTGSHTVDPRIVDLSITSDGFVVASLSTMDGVFIGTEWDMTRNWYNLLDAAGLTDAEWKAANTHYRTMVEDARRG